MIFKYDEITNRLEMITKEEWIKIRLPFEIAKGKNGKNFVTLKSVVNYIIHVSEGNSKTGEHCLNFNFSIEHTCNHDCECYIEGLCYAEGGCYLFGDNQCGYTENVVFYNSVPDEIFIAALQKAIDITGFGLFRFFTCGDIPNYRFIEIMVKLAKDNPSIEFWSYTKKYQLCNRYVAEHGGSIEKAFPKNLVIIFSHWLNQDGSYYPMENPYNFPTSEFIPIGKEHLAKKATFICPCSDPTVNVTCKTCENKCYRLKPGQSQALLEHSTTNTKERDKEIKTAKKAVKKAGKQAKKAS